MNNGCITLSIYSRPECHLCDDLVSELQTWQSSYQFNIEIINIDTDTALTARYAARIPLLAHGDTEICQYFLDVQQLQQFLDNTGLKRQTD